MIHVAVAAIVNEQNEVFICKRHADSHQGGLWEFPGGKVEADENIQQALVRELHEETGIEITQSRPLIRVHHDYGDKSVLLDVWKIQQYTGRPHGRESQPVRWTKIAALNPEEFPAADLAIIKALQLPERYLITGDFTSLVDFTAKLSRALDNGIRLVQLRIKPKQLKDDKAFIIQLLKNAENQCETAGITLLLNVPDELRAQSHCTNIHADSNKLTQLRERPQCKLFCASCHTLADLRKAEKLNVDFAVLSPVKHTSSHPGTEPMGWEKFHSMIDEVSVPVYALGGVGEVDIENSQLHGGQGVAAIGAFWDKVQRSD